MIRSGPYSNSVIFNVLGASTEIVGMLNQQVEKVFLRKIQKDHCLNA